MPSGPVFLFSNAKGGENLIYDIVCRRCSGDRVDRMQRAVKIEHQEFVGYAGFGRAPSFLQHPEGLPQQILLAHAGYEAALHLERAARRESSEDCFAKAIDSLAGAGGNGDLRLSPDTEIWQVRLVGDSQETPLIACFADQLAVLL